MRLALSEAALGGVLLVVALTVATGAGRSGTLVVGLAMLVTALINFAVQWYFRGRTVRVDAREHYFGRKTK